VKQASLRQAFKTAISLPVIITSFFALVLLLILGYSIARTILQYQANAASTILSTLVSPYLVMEDHQSLKSILERIIESSSGTIVEIKVKLGDSEIVVSRESSQNADDIFKTAHYFEAFGEKGSLEITQNIRIVKSFLSKNLFLLLIATLAIIGVGQVLALRFYKNISQPITDLLNDSQKIASQKDYSVRFKEEGPEEIKGIIKALNSMLAEIEARDNNLEALVDQRTKELLAQKLKLEENLEEIKKLSEAKNVFLANVSHEIRTPMNAIYSLVEDWKNRLSKTQDIDHYRLSQDLELMAQSGSLLLSILNDLIDFNRTLANKIELQLKPFNLAKLVVDTTKLFVSEAKQKGLNLRVEIDKNLQELFILGDEFRLQQILTNLLSNAVKFTEEGQVTVYLQGSVGEGKLTVELSVEDTGIGIPPEKINSIFDPFTQAESGYTRRAGGLGLGLSIVKHLVQLMNGKISVKTSPSGSTFTVSFEAKIVDSRKIANNNHQDRSLKDYKILIVEDNEVNQLLLERILKSLDAKTYLAENGSEAVELVKSKYFDLVLMDIQMPGMDGLTATKIIKSQFPHLPVLAVTAHAFLEEIEKCREAGCDDVITKPVKKTELLEKIFRYLDMSKTKVVEEAQV
jgi:two-component system, sensor histidine kinase